MTDSDPFEPAPFDPERFEAALPPPRPEAVRWLWTLPLIGLLVVVLVVPIPYFLVTPGPAEDVIPLIKISGHTTYPTEGHLLLTAVGFTPVNAYQAIYSLIAPNRELVRESDYVVPEQTQTQQVQVSLSEMDTSKIDAAVVVLSKYAGYPKKNRPGALVERVIPGTPAEGRLFAGDLIVSVDGTTIGGPNQLGDVIVGAGVGHALSFTIRAGGRTRTERIAPVRVPGVDHPIIGISSVNNFPFPLTISSGNIGGPSAGLMWTLGLIDVLTAGDLTGGRVVAGTGTIDPTGAVGPIGGIKEKVVAAERAGAKVFFAPAEEAEDARAVADEIAIVPVRTYLDALNYLQNG